MLLSEARFGELDAYLFGQGNHNEIYKKLGAHPAEDEKGNKGFYFAVWAPNALRVSVVGEFNEWGEKDGGCFMEKVGDIGVWDVFIPGIKIGDMYKFRIFAANGRILDKADPYGNWAELRPGTASRAADISDFKWTDSAWLKKRAKTDVHTNPMAVYEVHPGSWRKHEATDENPAGYYNYREFAEELADYVKSMGYTHVELMGIAEHPFDGSWGYQVTGYYAPTARHGSPLDFKYLVDYLHNKGIGVILDWVPAHFPKDACGLAEFDGTCCYEHMDPRQGEHPDWGTKIFNYGRPEVKNFLLGNALYWVEEYHVDGLRVDAVASMLYLDYGKRDGGWVANKYGGRENLEAIAFFKHMNSCVQGRNPGVMTIAEESTAWPKVTGSVEDNGLGFTLKWNMGWMHDFLDYMKLDPYFRKDNHNKMTFSLMYAFSENFILVLSHDEVVHLKCSMLNKMPGYPDDKFENLKCGYAFMTGHPGKKLLFMGQDFGQLQEWSEERELDWYLLEEDNHKNLQKFYKDLLAMYTQYPALGKNDAGYEGFQWINADDCFRSIFSFVRWSPTKRNNLLFVINFTPVAREDYRVGVPKKKKYTLIMNSKDPKYGGDFEPETTYTAEKIACDGQKYSIAYPLPAYGVAVFKF